MVNPQLHEGTAGAGLPVVAPLVRRQPSRQGEVGLRQHHLAEPSLFEQSLGAPCRPEPPEAVPHQQGDPGAPAGIVHLRRLGQRIGHGLLHEDMSSRSGAGCGLPGVHVVGGGQDHAPGLWMRHGLLERVGRLIAELGDEGPPPLCMATEAADDVQP